VEYPDWDRVRLLSDSQIAVLGALWALEHISVKVTEGSCADRHLWGRVRWPSGGSVRRSAAVPSGASRRRMFLKGALVDSFSVSIPLIARHK
jgi:hypothetical protein